MYNHTAKLVNNVIYLPTELLVKSVFFMLLT